MPNVTIRKKAMISQPMNGLTELSTMRRKNTDSTLSMQKMKRTTKLR